MARSKSPSHHVSWGEIARCGFLSCLLLGSMTFVQADQPVFATLLQDEPVELPAENTALFSTAGVVSIELDMLAAMDQSRAKDVLVTIVRPDGSKTNLRPDEKGRVQITNTKRGPHAVVANGKGVHGATLFYFEEKPTGDDTKVNDAKPKDEGKTDDAKESNSAKMTLAVVREKELLPFVDRIREVGESDSPNILEESVDAGGPFRFRVKMSDQSSVG
ncbi:MAG: hypothetical protein AB8B91_25215, partial [Rubripirellula sp.]